MFVFFSSVSYSNPSNACATVRPTEREMQRMNGKPDTQNIVMATSIEKCCCYELWVVIAWRCDAHRPCGDTSIQETYSIHMNYIEHTRALQPYAKQHRLLVAAILSLRGITPIHPIVSSGVRCVPSPPPSLRLCCGEYVSVWVRSARSGRHHHRRLPSNCGAVNDLHIIVSSFDERYYTHSGARTVDATIENLLRYRIAYGFSSLFECVHSNWEKRDVKAGRSLNRRANASQWTNGVFLPLCVIRVCGCVFAFP